MPGVCLWVRLNVPNFDETRFAEDFPSVEVLAGEDLPADDLARVSVLFSDHPYDDELIQAMPALQWVQTTYGGAGRFLSPSVKERPIRLTTCTGIHGATFSEFALASMLAMAKSIPEVLDAQDAHEWRRSIQTTKLEGRTIGIVGLGTIGSALAQRAKAMGMRVLAVRRAVTETPTYVDRLATAEGLYELLTESDYVVVSVVSGDSTHGLMGRTEFATMKPGAFFVNLTGGREVFDESALIDSLTSGHLRGATVNMLSGTPVEPDSPLWDAPNLIVVPALAGDDPDKREKQYGIFVGNMHAFLAGDPLKNEVDKVRGY